MATNDPLDPTTPPPAAPVAPAAAPVPSAAPAVPASRPSGPSALGVIAFLAALVGLVVGAVLTFLGGQAAGALVQYADSRGQLDANSLPESAVQAAAQGGVLIGIGFLVWGVLALWGLIQGIVAIVRRRGRGWGVAAIIVAVVGGIVVSVFIGVGAAVGAAPYASQITQSTR